MAVPKKRTSSSKTRMRRSHDGLKRTYAIVCPKCGEPALRHHACPACGHYRGRDIVAIKSKSKE